MRRLIQVSSRPGCGRRAAVDHRLERGVDGDAENIRAHRARQPRSDAKAVERNQPADFRLDPEQRRIVDAFRHRKNAAGISAQQHFRRDIGRGGVAGVHGRQNSRSDGGRVRWGRRACLKVSPFGKRAMVLESGKNSGGVLVNIKWKTIAPLVIWLAIYLIPVPAGLNANQWHYFAVFAAVIAGPDPGIHAGGRGRPDRPDLRRRDGLRRTRSQQIAALDAERVFRKHGVADRRRLRVLDRIPQERPRQADCAAAGARPRPPHHRSRLCRCVRRSRSGSGDAVQYRAQRRHGIIRSSAISRGSTAPSPDPPRARSAPM